MPFSALVRPNICIQQTLLSTVKQMKRVTCLLIHFGLLLWGTYQGYARTKCQDYPVHLCDYHSHEGWECCFQALKKACPTALAPSLDWHPQPVDKHTCAGRREGHDSVCWMRLMTAKSEGLMDRGLPFHLCSLTCKLVIVMVLEAQLNR